jgi:hypothetical protein
MSEERITPEGTESRVAPADARYSNVRERFGGIDTPAALGGMFAALGMLGLLIAVTSVAAIPLQLNAIDTRGEILELGRAGVVVATLVILTSFILGGWVAARMARFDGVINGVGVALWMLLLVAVSAAAGIFLDARYNLFQRAGLPDWFSQIRGDDVTTLAMVAAVLAIAAVFTGSMIGGWAGNGYNRKVDSAMVHSDTVVTERSDIYRSDR